MDQILRGADSINSMTSSMRQSVKSFVTLTSPEQREQVSGFKNEALEDGTNGENPFRKKWKVFLDLFELLIAILQKKEGEKGECWCVFVCVCVCV